MKINEDRPLGKKYSSENALANLKVNKDSTFLTNEKSLFTETTQLDFDKKAFKNRDKEIAKKLFDDEDDSNETSTANVLLSETLLYDPKLKRRDIKENYEKPVTERENWWRVTIKDTPLPSAYETTRNSFLTEIKKKPNTYSFKSDGRRLNPMPHIGKGEYLMPGAYEQPNFIDRLTKLKVSYGFKGPEREDLLEKSIIGYHDKNVQVSPGAYNTEKYNQINADVEPLKHGFFKSKSKRKVFVPRDGPPPGCYESSSFTDKPRAISSCFRSKTSRFPKSQTLTPGPGSYWPLTQWPVSKNIEKLGEKGVFFTTNFKEVSY